MPAKAHLSKYLDWMKQQFEKCARDEMLHGGSEWLNLVQHPGLVSEKIQGIADTWAGKLLLRMGPQVSAVLKGAADPLDLMFQDDMISSVYRFGYGADIVYEKMENYIDLLAHKNPQMKILEIGAGTGSATESVLRALSRHGDGEEGRPRFHSYTFTDVSASFFQGAREIFVEYIDKMSFRTFDVEKDPEGQGIEIGSYDLVVAASVS